MPTKVRTAKKVGIDLIGIAAIVILIVLVGLGGHFLGKYNEGNKNTAEISGVQTFSYEGENGKSALDLLKDKADVQTTDSSIGSFVVSINGTANSETNFWIFYVNGEMATTSADQYQTKDGDQIEWRYEAFN